MAEGGLLLVTFMLSFSVLLVVISAVQSLHEKHHHTRSCNFDVSWSNPPVVPNLTHEVEDFYGITERIPEIILYVIIPILIFESGRKLSIKQIEKSNTDWFLFDYRSNNNYPNHRNCSYYYISDSSYRRLTFWNYSAATDPVAVGIIFKKFPIPHRLNLIIEGESLFNDATGVISFNVVKGIILLRGGLFPARCSLSFIWTMVGAIAFGTGLGWIGGKFLTSGRLMEHGFHFFLRIGYCVAI